MKCLVNRTDPSSFIAPVKRIVACMLRLDKIYETLSLKSRVRVANVLLSTGVGLGSDGTDKRRILLQRSSNRGKKKFFSLRREDSGVSKECLVVVLAHGCWTLDINPHLCYEWIHTLQKVSFFPYK